MEGAVESKKFSTIVIVGILVLVMIVVSSAYFYLRPKETREDKGNTQEEQREKIDTSLETAADSTKVDIPEVNPIDAAVPDVNPIDRANPFKNVYENPFE